MIKAYCRNCMEKTIIGDIHCTPTNEQSFDDEGNIIEFEMEVEGTCEECGNEAESREYFKQIDTNPSVEMCGMYYPQGDEKAKFFEQEL